MKTLFLIASFYLISSTAHADSWAESNIAIVDDFAIPSYKTLQEKSKELVEASNSFCSTRNSDSFEKLKSNFHSTMDAWQSIQVLRSGPAGKFMRSFRLEMWPDRSNAAAKHLRKLQLDANPESLESKKFSKASVAIQGLSAMERVIFAKEISHEAFETDDKANFKCQLIEAIALNVQTISNDLLKAWQGDYRDVIAKPSKENDFYETDKEAAAQFLNELSTQLQVVIDQKINRPIDGDKFRLTRAESWRSGRSLRNIALNLDSAKNLYQIGFSSHVSDEGLRKKQQALFDTAIRLGKELEIPLKDAYENQSDSLNNWIKSIKELKASISGELPKAIDIPLGFNSLDGD